MKKNLRWVADEKASDSFRLEFQTPPRVANYMASMIPKNCITILEPTPGIGRLVKAIQRRSPGYQITAPDDFFLLTKRRLIYGIHDRKKSDSLLRWKNVHPARNTSTDPGA